MSNLPLRRRHRSAVRHSNREADSEIALLSAEERTLRDRITDLERFIVKAPELAERAQVAQRDRLNTLPPPDEFRAGATGGYTREPDYTPKRLTRAQEQVLRRRRALNLVHFIAVALAVAAFAIWFADNL